MSQSTDFDKQSASSLAGTTLTLLSSRFGTSDRYTLDQPLGQGGFGTVWIAVDEQLHRRVAIKLPSPQRFKTADNVEAFLSEAKLVASLDHPNIVPVFDVGKMTEGAPYIITKLIEGENLAVRLARERPNPQDSADIIATVARALDYAHERNVIHRDVKPANILLERKTHCPYVTDFGLAVKRDDYLRLGSTAGTPAYMSPEQVCGDPNIDGRSDIFSLGVVFYQALTGARPFDGKTTSDLFDEILKKDPIPPTDLNGDVPDELARICLKCLSKRRGDRYPSGSQLARDLTLWLTLHGGTWNEQVYEMPAKHVSREPVQQRTSNGLWKYLTVTFLAVASVQTWRLSVARDQFQAANRKLKSTEDASRLATRQAEEMRRQLEVQITSLEEELGQVKVAVEQTIQDSIRVQKNLQRSTREFERATADHNRYRQTSELTLGQHLSTIEKLREELMQKNSIPSRSLDSVEILSRLTREQRQAAAMVHEGISYLAKDKAELAARLFESAGDPKYSYPLALYYHAFALVRNAKSVAEIDAAMRLLEEYVERAKPKDVSDVERLRSGARSKRREVSKSTAR